MFRVIRESKSPAVTDFLVGRIWLRIAFTSKWLGLRLQQELVRRYFTCNIYIDWQLLIVPLAKYNQIMFYCFTILHIAAIISLTVRSPNSVFRLLLYLLPAILLTAGLYGPNCFYLHPMTSFSKRRLAGSLFTSNPFFSRSSTTLSIN